MIESIDLLASLATHDRIAQGAKLIDANLDQVTRLQGELFLRDERCTCKEKYPIREVVLKKEVCYQFIKPALEFSHACLTFPVYLVIALDGQVDGEVVRV